jgi:hypothetical protein
MRIGTRVPLGFEAKIRYCDRVLRVPIRDNGRGIDSRMLKEGGIAGIADCGARVNALSALELDLIFGARPEPALRCSSRSPRTLLTRARVTTLGHACFAR